MCHFKEIQNGCKNIIVDLGGTKPPFRANLLFEYVQSGSERTSFLGSTVRATTQRFFGKVDPKLVLKTCRKKI